MERDHRTVSSYLYGCAVQLADAPARREHTAYVDRNSQALAASEQAGVAAGNCGADKVSHSPQTGQSALGSLRRSDLR